MPPPQPAPGDLQPRNTQALYERTASHQMHSICPSPQRNCQASTVHLTSVTCCSSYVVIASRNRDVLPPKDRSLPNAMEHKMHIDTRSIEPAHRWNMVGIDQGVSIRQALHLHLREVEAIAAHHCGTEHHGHGVGYILTCNVRGRTMHLQYPSTSPQGSPCIKRP